MSQSRVERFIRQLQGKPVPKKPSNENDAAEKTRDRELSDAELKTVAGAGGSKGDPNDKPPPPPANSV